MFRKKSKVQTYEEKTNNIKHFSNSGKRKRRKKTYSKNGFYWTI